MGKINIAELLKVCPTDMELDCVINENVYFDKIIDDDNSIYPIRCYVIENGVRNSIYFTKYGEFCNTETAKCVIFPKGKTTWEGFVPPVEFKDGDVISDSLGTCIFKGEGVIQGTVDYYCGVHGDYFIAKENTDVHYGDIVDYRFATEEEKQKLFDTIKDNGYKWNAETKTLEKLIEPKFKVGDRIRHKENTSWVCTIARVEDRYYVDGHPTCYTILFDSQNEYELIPNKFDITTLKPFESRVLVREDKTDVWQPAIYGFFNQENKRFYTTSTTWLMCIPYNEDTNHLLGTTNECDDFYKTWE